MTAEITKSQELFERRKNAVANGVGVFNTATARDAKGAIITNEDGEELIDFAGGIGVVNAGHCPEPVVAAIREQAGKYLHTSFNVVTYEPYVELCEQLCEILPHGEKTKAMLISTGAEAVENAVKIARMATKRQAVLCFTDAYHGRTMMAMTLTSKINYKIDCGPFAPEVYRLPFPNYYRYGNGLSLDDYIDQELRRLDDSGHNLIVPDSLAAIILEPIQGEGGFYAVPQRYLEGLRAYCDQHGIMLILDEVQSGFARTGNWASWQDFGVSICYDMWFPETIRTLTVMGAEVILHPTMTGTIDRDAELSIARAMATVNQCYLFDVNGLETGGNGRSIVCGPDGRVIYQAGSTEEIFPLELNIERVKRSRELGVLRLGQPLKSFRDHIGDFTIYQKGERHPYLEQLGPLIKPKKLGVLSELKQKESELEIPISGIAYKGDEAIPAADTAFLG